MGTYVYRLAKRSDCIEASINGRVEKIGVFEYAYKPYYCWDGQKLNEKWERQARFAVNASWRNSERPNYCIIAFRNDDGKLEFDTESSIMKYADDLIYDDYYVGNPQFTIGKLTLLPDETRFEPNEAFIAAHS